MTLYEQPAIIYSLKNQVARVSETPVNLHQTTRRHTPENSVRISNFTLMFVFRFGRH